MTIAGGDSAHGQPSAPVRLHTAGGEPITATLTSLHWTEDRGWLACVHHAGAPMGMEWVPIERIQRTAGVDYGVIRPSWWARNERGRWIEHDHPPV